VEMDTCSSLGGNNEEWVRYSAFGR